MCKLCTIGNPLEMNKNKEGIKDGVVSKVSGVGTEYGKFVDVLERDLPEVQVSLNKVCCHSYP